MQAATRPKLDKVDLLIIPTVLLHYIVAETEQERKGFGQVMLFPCRSLYPVACIPCVRLIDADMYEQPAYTTSATDDASLKQGQCLSTGIGAIYQRAWALLA